MRHLFAYPPYSVTAMNLKSMNFISFPLVRSIADIQHGLRFHLPKYISYLGLRDLDASGHVSRLTQYCFLFCLLSGSNLAQAGNTATSIDQTIRKELDRIYLETARIVSKNSVTFSSDKYFDQDLRYSFDDLLETYSIKGGGLLVKAWGKPLSLKSVLILHEASKAIQAEGESIIIPSFSVDTVIKQSIEYLASLDFKLSANLRIKSISFNQTYSKCWEIRWGPTFQNIEMDDFDAFSVEDICAVFNEKTGFVYAGTSIHTSAPRSISIQITSEEALLKAAALVPRIQQHPNYLKMRRPGFTVKGLISCSLKIARPNYFFTNGKGKKGSHDSLLESRLCWIFRFSSIYSAISTTNKHHDRVLVAPDFVVYIDTETGECIGADFT
ncbi:hypothetical protein OpiT1DRAFT_05918 [Opitutaceae bacterium TAV1]|nr:hypothetical protein OpiT1DRAFT_05918 [Opitutaceae bacterium TAV1]